MQNEPLHSLYERNPETGDYIIEISLDKYADVFNEWDHATYGKRDMDPELAFFLEECSAEIPLHHGIDLAFYLPQQAMDARKERIISNVVRSYYEFYANAERRALSRAYRQMANYILVAIGLLTATYLFNFWQQSVVLSIAAEGLMVGSWFFLWEAISFLIFERSDNAAKIKTYERLSNADIYFYYDA